MAHRNPASGFAYLFERFPSFVQTFVYREAVEMVRQGAAPWLVSVRTPDDPGELAEPVGTEVFYLPEEKELRAEVDASRAAGQLGWSIHRAIPRRRGAKDSQRMFEAIWLGPRLKEKGIRHVHAHFGGLAARTAWWLRHLHGIGYSFTGHANDIFCDTDFPVTNAQLARDAKFIVTETDFARRWMEDRYPFARGKVFRVFNGIDPAGFFPREASEAVPRILSVGRYVEKKGFDVLIDACALLRDRGVAFTCEIIGEGPLHDSLAAQIERLRLADHVRLLGPRPQTDVRKALAKAQIFALACQQDSEGGSDNLPTVIAEAMMTGLPCISTPIAGVPEMITDGQDGLLVATREPVALADAAARVLGDHALSARLGERAKTSARERFSIDRTVAELKNLIESHLPRRGWWPW